jgi:hypothetical protein
MDLFFHDVFSKWTAKVSQDQRIYKGLYKILYNDSLRSGALLGLGGDFVEIPYPGKRPFAPCLQSHDDPG